MQLTIRDALKTSALAGARVIAGEDRLDNVIESISVMEVAEAGIARWVIKNQMYITAFYAIKDNVEMQKVVIRTLANCGCCGLVVCHIDLWIKEMDQEIIDLCNECHFPLIIARPETSYIEILTPIINALSKEDQSLPESEDYFKIRSDFLDLIINEDDINTVFKKVSRKEKRKISYFDIYCEKIYSDKSPAQVEYESSYLKDHFNDIIDECASTGFTMAEAKEKSLLISLIRSHKNFYGFIVLSGHEEHMNNATLDLLNQLSVSCKLLFSRRYKMLDVKEKYLQEYLGDLLVWNFPSEEVAIKRGIESGLDIVHKNNIILININLLQSSLTSATEKNEMAYYIKTVVLPYLVKILYQYGHNNNVTFRSDTVIIFLANPDNLLDLQEISSKIMVLFHRERIASISIGISNYFNHVRDIPGGYNQSFQAAILGREHYGENRIVFYKDVWFWHRLRVIGEEQQAAEMCKYLLAPLEEYDAVHHSDLTESLFQLLESNGNVHTVAEKLYVHRNTMLQRKNKITEIYGYSPFEMPHLLNFLMAMEICK
ncbi:MAG TPA: PucR family transcriptional regulator ligand-binding domain-containing protein [Syntrophomonas sp.]|nr:PucR family transcriptional regulator ligand-binding domain-containing protein [Syntrophomonas sp.]